MNDVALAQLAVILWQGFSLTFIIVILVRELRNTYGKIRTGSPSVAFSRRLAMSFFGVVGLFGTATFTGAASARITEAPIVLLLGMVAGIWGAWNVEMEKN